MIISIIQQWVFSSAVHFHNGPFLFFVVADVMSNYLTTDGLKKNFLYYRRPPWGPRPVAFATSATWLIRHWTWFVLATPVWANERYTVAVIAAAAAAAAAVGIYIIVRTSDRFVRYALHAVSREPLPRWRLSRSARLQMLCTGCLELTAENCR